MSYTVTDKCDGCRLCAANCPAFAIRGEKKKLHVIDEALCVECGVCGRICKPEAILDGNGEICRMVPRNQWEKPVFDLETCVACGACVHECPVNAIGQRLRKKKDTNLYPFMEKPKKCIACGFCVDICASGSIKLAPPQDQSGLKEAS